LTEPPAATPIDPDEAAGLRLRWVATRGELDAVEAENITAGLRWAARRRLRVADVLNDEFLRELHRRMFGDVWRWAGQYRKTEKNIGVEPYQIALRVRDLVADALVWTADPDPGAWPRDEVCVRFHHRLVWIHPFPNGNGRHGRAAADLLLGALGGPPFTWGRASLDHPGEVRSTYIAALRAADAHDYGPLLAFVRS
jgi:Fic-DOC domain mobile mystery protein B